QAVPPPSRRNQTVLRGFQLIEQNKPVAVAKSTLLVTPSRNWNRLNGSVGKSTERWTLDGPQLNEITFFSGIPAGNPIFKERNKEREPLPKFSADTLLIEIPELLEGSYRPYKGLVDFKVTKIEPKQFVGSDGVAFEYQFTDNDGLIRLGAARAAIVKGRLYMITFDAPRLHYFPSGTPDFIQIADSAKLS
ncbi:MAG: hypothetical protein KJZ64_10050, partial [Sphingomonadaceae bacterium]|nr:hypothetical protein [Sphingomonadaceae bacterium]